MRRTLAAACACACAAVSFIGVDAAPPLRPEFTGSRAVVAAGRSFTVDAGARLIDEGGNAIDAGVASIFAAAVVEISHFGLGGESPIIIASARDRKVVVINGQGPAPKDAVPALFKGQPAPPGNGPLGATVPAVVDAAALALAQYGTKSLADVMAPAIALADGFPMYEFLSHYLEIERENCLPYPATMATYYPDGRVTPAGEIFRQPNLARTLRAIVAAEKAARAAGKSRVDAIRAGRDAFYTGDIARRIAAANREAGGVMTEADLASYRGRIEEPQTTRYRGYDVYKAGPWNQSPVLLQTLNLLEGFDLATMGPQSADALHVIAESIKLAYADRDRYYGDPDFVDVPIRGLLSKAYADARRKLIDLASASREHRPGDPLPFNRPATSSSVRLPSLLVAPLATPVVAPGSLPREPGDTTAIQVVDAEGNLFSATPSSGWLLGGAFVAGDTGVPMGNRMQAFRLDPASPNVLQGGKRPRTTLTPTVVMKDGAPFLAIGTPGGDSQDQQILLVLLNVIDFRMDLQAAIEAPRVNSLHPESSFDDHRAQPGVLEAESSLGPDVLAALRARGHDLRVRTPYGISTGIVAAGRDPVTRRLRGGADPRRERYVVAW